LLKRRLKFVCSLDGSGLPSDDREAACLTDMGTLAIERWIIVRGTLEGLERLDFC
jgi:hypothetical protein